MAPFLLDIFELEYYFLGYKYSLSPLRNQKYFTSKFLQSVLKNPQETPKELHKSMAQPQTPHRVGALGL